MNTLNASMRRLGDILGDHGLIAKARELPTKAVYELKRLRPTYDSGYGKNVPPEIVQIASRALEKAADDLAAEAARERDEIIAKLATEIDMIRADLPRQAAAYSIELGQITRGLRG